MRANALFIITVENEKLSPLAYSSLKFFAFVQWFVLKLSISDVIVSRKGSNVDGKLHFFGLDYNFTCTLCAKYEKYVTLSIYV